MSERWLFELMDEMAMNSDVVIQFNSVQFLLDFPNKLLPTFVVIFTTTYTSGSNVMLSNCM